MISSSLIGRHNLVEQPIVARALRFTLAANVGSALLIALVTRFLGWPLIPQLSLMAAALTAVAIALDRSGHTRTGIFLALVAVGYAVMHAAAVNDGIQSIGLAVVPALIVFASLLLGRLSLLLFTSGAIVATVAMLAIRYYVLRLEIYSNNDLGDFIIFVVICTTSALIGRILAAGIAKGLQSEKDRLAAVIASITDEVWFADANKQIDFVNPAAAREFLMGGAGGLDVKKVAASLKVFRPDGTARPIDEIPLLRALAGETIRGEEEIVETPGSGELRHRQVNAAPVKDTSGSIIGSVSVVRDITEVKRADQMLRDSERRFRSLFENSFDAVFLTADGGSIEAANPAACRMFGMTEQEFCSTRPNGFAGGSDGVRKLLESRRFTGSVEGELKLVRNDGTSFEAEVGSAMLDEDRRAFVTARDITRRKWAEQALRESEERLRLFIDNAPAAIAMFDGEMRYIAVSRRWRAEYLGGNECLGRSHYKVFPECPERWRAAHRKGLAGEIVRVDEDLWGRGDGTELWSRYEVRPWHGGDGDIGGIIIFSEDITERKRAEEALRDNEQRLNSIYNTVADIIFQLAVEPEGQFRFVSVNAAFLKVTGLSREAVIGKRVNDVIPEPSLTTVLRKYRQAVDDNAIVCWEETSDYPAGRLTGEVRVAPVLDEKGRCTCLVGSVHDITERKRVEAALVESEERYRMIIQAAMDGFVLVDTLGHVREVNDAYCRMSGYTKQELLGMRVHDLNSGETPDETTARMQQIMAQGEIRFESMHRRKEGSVFDVEVSVQYRPSGRGRYVYFLRDITQRKRADAAQFEKQKLETVGTLASGIAHDFNNLLGGVLSQAELALAEIEDGSYPVESLKAIEDVAIRGSEIVRELMVYAGKERAVAGPVDVSRLVEEMHGLLNVSISKHAKLELDLERDTPAVWTNAAELGQIVLNLVTNASEAIGTVDGVIRLTTKRVAGRESFESISEGVDDREYIQLEVTDTGSGMSDETRNRVFDPFFTTKSAGRGLGMAVVQGIVRGLGGAVRLVSSPAKGTTVQVLLPGAIKPAEAAPSPRPARYAPPLPSHEATILVVEDEDSLRQPVSKLLRKEGFSVIEASDGTAALEIIREHKSPIDFLLLDITLPGASSGEILKEAMRLRHATKVVVTSAYTEDVAAEVLQAKIKHFLRKPYMIGDLVDLLQRTNT